MNSTFVTTPPQEGLPTNAVTAITVSISLVLLTCTIFGISVHAQVSLGNKLYKDTYFIGSALLVAIALAILTIYRAVDGGIGWPLSKQRDLGAAVQSTRFTHQMLSTVSIQLLRVGLLLLYARIFSIRAFRIAVTALIALTVMYFVVFVAGMSALYAYSPDNSRSVISLPAWYLSTAAIPALLDLATLCMPLAVIWSLNISAKQKIGLVACFGLGGVCVFSSIARLYYFAEINTATSPDRALEISFNIIVWSTVEPFTSIIAACLPTCATLLRGSAKQRRTEATQTKLSLKSNIGKEEEEERWRTRSQTTV